MTILDLAHPRIALIDDNRSWLETLSQYLREQGWFPVTADDGGRREARMVTDYEQIPAGAERVIFFPRAAGG